MSTLNASSITELRSGFEGTILLPGDEGYDEARTVWNATIDRRPAVIARCAGTSDVIRAVAFARRHGLTLAVRGGGHNIAGSALTEGGLVVDLSRMKAVRVDPGQRRVVVEGGALLADLDHATLAHGLAVPVGINSTTGIAGLTLGGGFGWLSRKLGMTVDSLASAEVVTADGRVLRASTAEHPDLFWALRGGSGNFGVVTRFEFRLHPVGPELLSGLLVYPFAEAKSVLRHFAEFMKRAPDELTVWGLLRHAPPLPFLPESVHGKLVVVLALVHAGDPKEGAALIEPLRHLGTPVGEHVGVQPFAAWQQAFDPLLAAGARNYWKSHNFHSLSDGLVDTVVDVVEQMPSPHSEVFLAALGGATMRPAVDATAYAHRDARFIINVHSRWLAPADDGPSVRWAKAFYEATAPFATGGVYVNFLTEDETERVAAAYGPNHARLAEIKRRYDPENLFRSNQNIRPA